MLQAVGRAGAKALGLEKSLHIRGTERRPESGEHGSGWGQIMPEVGRVCAGLRSRVNVSGPSQGQGEVRGVFQEKMWQDRTSLWLQGGGGLERLRGSGGWLTG